MTLKQTIYIALASVSLVIGVHRCIVDGETVSLSAAVGYNYWIFMISLAFLMLYRYDKKKQNS